VAAVGAYLPLTLLAPLQSVAAAQIPYQSSATVAPTITLPSYGSSAISAVGYPKVLVQGGNTAPMPIASITKIITALVVLQKDPLTVGESGPQIKFTSADEAIRKAYLARNGDVYPIRVGSSMSQLNVMQIALIASANNYSRALADWAYGSEAAFLPVANAWLKQNGMTSTILTDSTGLNPANKSTPTDLITLGKIALANPLIAQIVDTKDATLPVVGAISNTNSLLGHLGVDGIKTGTLDGAGSSLLFTSTFTIGGTQIRLIGVVLDGPTHPIIDAEIRGLIKTVKSGFTAVKLTSAGEPFATYTTLWGATARAVAARSQSVVVWKGTNVDSTISTSKVVTSVKGLTVGSITFDVGGTSIAVPLKLDKPIADPSFWWRVTNPGILR
jgi:D-alanyl-D-alanine carboxypeptidase (penicillin-binding protein 5/6)